MNILTLPIIALSTLPFANPPAKVDYLRDIKPILSARCFACHAAVKQKGGLRVDTAALMHKGGYNGAAIVPGNSDASLLIKRVTRAKGFSRMPPRKEGDPLEPEQIALLRRWIDEGAKAPDDEMPETNPREHWAYKKPARPQVSVVKNTKWVRNPIDAFIAKQHEKHGLVPQPPVEKRLLLRRVYLDLIGLPPTQEEIAAFLKDESSDAYENAVDRLLSSPQYGERWGRHWMDIWRYSDWWGLGQQLRNSQKHIWHWRDWIVESLNKDKGYDRMILEMLAADELYPTDWDALRGTGYLARQYFLFNRNTWLDETVEHTSKAFLGITMNCVKCHDHKYDPIEHEEYYRFRAFFEPYQVRLDQVAGETDFAKNGIPRAFDCNLDAPTYVHIRGNEQQPDKTRKIKPGLPEFFAPKGIEIQPVKLPPKAYQPGLRPVVVENNLHDAKEQLAAAQKKLVDAKQQLHLAEKRNVEKPEKKKTEPKQPARLQDDFAKIDPKIWEKDGGQWRVENGKVVQKQTGNTRGVLTLKQAPPTDFEARFRFAILGGKRYHSVGIAFDAKGDREYLVYLTACAGQERVQFTYKDDGKQVYPKNLRQMRKVPLNQPHEMTIRVRGSLLNVLINDENAFACQLPKGRTPGRLKLITFDAAARFERFALSDLPDDVKLVEASTKTASPAAKITVEQARAAIVVAEKAIAAAEQRIIAIKARAAADQAVAMNPDVLKTKERVAKAALMEKQEAVAGAELELAKAQHERIRDENKKTLDKVKNAEAALAKAKKELANPSTKQHTPLRGALKSLESNLESETSRRKPFPKTSTGRRSALAKWIASRDNPLTARVAVNHMWAKHFGQPLVPTVFNFGLKGKSPTHPKLLDWLAVELMENGWSMKHIHRLIVTSNTYRMTSSAAGTPESNFEKDTDNIYYWRMPTKRMQSQVVRDSLLHLAGDLDLTLGGPPIEGGQQATSRRRSLYFFHSAIKRNEFLTTFDEADPLDCYRRRESIVPQQALALSNSKLALDMAEKITQQLESQFAKSTDREFVRESFTLILCYEPNDRELSACTSAMERWREIYAKDANKEHRARSMLVSTLLNHNDFITIR